MKTLEQILAKEKDRRVEKGAFGIDACKEMVRWYKEQGKGYYQQLEEYVNEVNTNVFFNGAMVLATWELINDVGVQ